MNLRTYLKMPRLPAAALKRFRKAWPSKCSLTACKLRFLGHFRLASPALADFAIGSKKNLLALLLFAHVAFSPTAQTGNVPNDLKPYQASYRVLHNGNEVAKSITVLSRAEGDLWQLRSSTEGSKGLADLLGAKIDEQGRFRWHDGLPELASYRYSQSIGWKTKKRSARADAQASVVVIEDGKKTQRLAWRPALIHQQTAALALAHGLKNGQTEFAYEVIGKDKIETQNYRVAGRETLSLPGGRYETIKIERVRQSADRSTFSWLAPALDYAVVRALQTEKDGKTIDMLLEQFQPAPASSTGQTPNVRAQSR